jgi:hypothetical protein
MAPPTPDNEAKFANPDNADPATEAAAPAATVAAATAASTGEEAPALSTSGARNAAFSCNTNSSGERLFREAMCDGELCIEQ